MKQSDKPTGGKTIEIKKGSELTKLHWAQGYFQSTFTNWDGDTWKRNFHEIRLRDLAVFPLGDIRGKKILDIGSGPGVYCLTFAHMGANVSGQDISEDCVQSATSLLKEEGFNCDLKVGDAQVLQFDDNSFDVVFSADFHEHISYEQKQKIIAESFRVMKPGGTLLIKTPNLNYLKLVIYLKRILALLKLKNPFQIHIAHTRNNPDNEHHGLTTHAELTRILHDNMFHTPEVILCPLVRKNLPELVTRMLYGRNLFSEHVIIVARKPIFYSLYP